MPHKCAAECACRHDLDAAVAAVLAEASQLLYNSVLSGSDESIENLLCVLRAVPELSFCGARGEKLIWIIG